jgi:hypothetical protein
MAAAYERQAKGFEALQRAAASLAESLERPLPPLPAAATRIAAGDGGVHLVARQQVGGLLCARHKAGNLHRRNLLHGHVGVPGCLIRHMDACSLYAKSAGVASKAFACMQRDEAARDCCRNASGSGSHLC